MFYDEKYNRFNQKTKKVIEEERIESHPELYDKVVIGRRKKQNVNIEKFY